MGGSAVASGSPIVDTNTKEYRRNKTFRAVEEVLKQRLRQREKTSQVSAARRRLISYKGYTAK
jgi:hypothetical protein